MSDIFQLFSSRLIPGTPQHRPAEAGKLWDAVVHDLQSRLKDYTAPVHPFKPGDIVRQKESLHIYRIATTAAPGIVVRVIDQDRAEGVGCNHDGEYDGRGDLVIGYINPTNGTFHTYVVDSRRMELHPGEQAYLKPDDDAAESLEASCAPCLSDEPDPAA